MNRLVISYQHNSDPNDDFGWLGVKVQTEGFSGSGGFWVQWQSLDKFGEALPQSPARLDKPVVAQWGYEMQEGNDLIIRIEIAPYGSLGELEASIEVADLNAAANRVRTQFKTTYSATDLFKRDIARLMAKEIETAELLGR